MHLELTTVPTATAIDWTNDLRGHLRLDTEDDRAWIERNIIPAVTQTAERETGRQLITATWTLFLDDFPASGIPIVLPKPPLQSVTSVKYYDTAGTLQTWDASNYTVVKPSGPFCQRGYIVPDYAIPYPSTQSIEDAVPIEYVCGYGAGSANIPALLRAAMLLLAGEQYEHREESVIGVSVSRSNKTAHDLLWHFRVFE